MSVAVIIVAAGRGTRAGGEMPKQWRPLAGQPVLAHTVRALSGFGRIVVVLHPDDMALGAEILGGSVTLVAGGETRDASVRNALELLAGTGIEQVLIHDGARPLVDTALVGRVLAALEGAEAAAPALPVSDALWRGAEGMVTGTEDRTGLRAVPPTMSRSPAPQAIRLRSSRAARTISRSPIPKISNGPRGYWGQEWISGWAMAMTCTPSPRAIMSSSAV